MTIPTGSPPPELVPKALSFLAMEVGKAAPLGPSGVLPPLSAFLGLLARHRVSAPLGPLHAFSTLCAASPVSVTLHLACDALLAYPAAVCVLDPALSHLKLDWDGLLAALPARLSAPGGVRAVRLAHSLLRMRSTVNVVVKHSEALMRALVKAYDGADTRAKGEMLVLARALVGKDTELRRRLENAGPRGVPLVNQSMGRDYADLFEAHRALGDAEAAATRGAHDEEHGTDPVRPPSSASAVVVLYFELTFSAWPTSQRSSRISRHTCSATRSRTQGSLPQGRTRTTRPRRSSTPSSATSCPPSSQRSRPLRLRTDRLPPHRRWRRPSSRCRNPRPPRRGDRSSLTRTSPRSGSRIRTFSFPPCTTARGAKLPISGT